MIPELEAWRIEGLTRASRLALDPAAINEGVATLQNVFGDAWLAGACARNAGGFWLERHPIGGLIIPPGDNQVPGLLELVEYLKFASASEHFRDRVAGLKAQFGPTFLQLAAGHRFKRLGASDLRFEPPVQGGMKGDLAFTLHGKRIVAECYIPRVKRTNSEVHWLLHRCMELREGLHPAVVGIAIKLKADLSAVQRKTILRLVRELSAQVDKSTEEGQPRSYYTETDAAHISAAPSRAVPPGMNSIGMQDPKFPDTHHEQPFVFGRISVGRAVRLKAGHLPTPIETRDHVAIWLSDADMIEHSLERDLVEPLKDLTRKVERKLEQTRVDSDTGRLLVVSSWMARQLRRAPQASIDDLRRRLFRKHQNVAGLLFMTHSHRSDIERPVYEFRALLPDDQQWLTDSEVSRLEQLEREAPVPAVVRRPA